jgi:SpoVK/Ycf46/Vps4 family AAA+-type ATPase
MTLRFGPKIEKEFIIVLKAPTGKLSCNLTSFINIKMANLRRNNSTAMDEDKFQEVQKHIKQRSCSSQMDFESMIEEKVIQKKLDIKVMIIGKLENAKIECMRELKHEES